MNDKDISTLIEASQKLAEMFELDTNYRNTAGSVGLALLTSDKHLLFTSINLDLKYGMTVLNFNKLTNLAFRGREYIKMVSLISGNIGKLLGDVTGGNIKLKSMVWIVLTIYLVLVGD